MGSRAPASVRCVAMGGGERRAAAARSGGLTIAAYDSDPARSSVRGSGQDRFQTLSSAPSESLTGGVAWISSRRLHCQSLEMRQRLAALSGRWKDLSREDQDPIGSSETAHSAKSPATLLSAHRSFGDRRPGLDLASGLGQIRNLARRQVERRWSRDLGDVNHSGESVSNVVVAGVVGV
jgi:hypothetical protein